MSTFTSYSLRSKPQSRCVAFCNLLFLVFLASLASQSDAFASSMLQPPSTTTTTTLYAANDDHPVIIAMTREEGKNEKLLKKIQQDNQLWSQVDVIELPCIAHASGPDYDNLASTLLSQKWNYVAITSPEAAKVLASAWDAVRDNPLPVVAVGKATETALQDSGIPVTFVPSKANAVTLAAELELVAGEGTSVLYPASAKAKKTLEQNLSARGFAVTRLNTYDTVTATWDEDQVGASKQVQVACFASPSSVKGWLQNTENNKNVAAACIGETSATACREQGWNENQIFFPEAPGLEGWVETIQNAMKAAKAQTSHSASTI